MTPTPIIFHNEIFIYLYPQYRKRATELLINTTDGKRSEENGKTFYKLIDWSMCDFN